MEEKIKKFMINCINGFIPPAAVMEGAWPAGGGPEQSAASPPAEQARTARKAALFEK